MKIAKQGKQFVFLGFGAFAACALGAHFTGSFALNVLAALSAVFTAFCAYFFRDPDRALPSDASKLYSPGDGWVLSVAREGPGDITTIRIFLSVFDVHVQRLPCSGLVDKVDYQKGSFVGAMRGAAKMNERSIVRVAVEGRKEHVVFEQIAGFIARRIVYWIKVGDRAVAGERYGIIHFGSQAAVHIPSSARPLVKPGGRVVGGITPIAEWTS